MAYVNRRIRMGCNNSWHIISHEDIHMLYNGLRFGRITSPFFCCSMWSCIDLLCFSLISINWIQSSTYTIPLCGDLQSCCFNDGNKHDAPFFTPIKPPSEKFEPNEFMTRRFIIICPCELVMRDCTNEAGFSTKESSHEASVRSISWPDMRS